MTHTADHATSAAATERRPNRRPWARLAVTSLLIAAAAAVPLGCDNVGDSKAISLEGEAAMLRTTGTSQAGRGTIEKNLSEVDGSDHVTPAVVQGQHAYGQYLVASADAEAASLSRLQGEASDLVFRIGTLLRQADTARAQADSARAMNPAERLTAANTFVNNVRGAGNQPTFTVLADAQSPKLATLAAAQQEKSRLDGEIAKTKETVANLTKQRDDVLTQAGQVAAAMEGQPSADRVKSATRTAELRQQAATLSRQISDANNALMRLQADDALQASLAEQLNGAIESTQSQAKAMQEGWTAVSAAADNEAKAGRALIEGNGEAGRPTVKSLVAELNKTLGEIDTQQKTVIEAYEKAVDRLGRAATNANTVVTDYTTAKSSGGPEPFEGRAWDDLISLMAVDRIGLDKANAEHALANARADHARLLTDLLTTAKLYDQVGPALKAQPSAPFDSAKLTTELNTALNDADKAYAVADNTIDGVNLTSKDLDGLRPAKATAKVLNLYSRAMLARLAEVGGAGGELPKKGGQYIKDAQAAADDAINGNSLTLPALPTEVSVQKKAPTPEGSDATTKPADETAPAAPAAGTPGT